jgi:hypothetical protein
VADNSKVDDYVKASDEANDYATVRIDEHKQPAAEDIDDLFRSTDRRDPELWSELDADAETTVDDYEQEEDRDLGWMLGMSTMSAASLTQYTMDNAESLILEPVAYREQVLSGFALTQAELVAAGKRGTVGFADELVKSFQPLQAKYIDDLGFLARMDPVDLYRTLRRFEALPSMETVTADAMGYVSRMTSYPAGSPQWKAAVSDLIDHNSGRALKSQSRTAIRQIYIEREAEGDDQTLMVWMGEGGKNTCGFCLDNFGVIKTLAQWSVDGMPGADVCAGGDLCKCALAAA